MLMTRVHLLVAMTEHPNLTGAGYRTIVPKNINRFQYLERCPSISNSYGVPAYSKEHTFGELSVLILHIA
jgi:hypothetical protein